MNIILCLGIAVIGIQIFALWKNLHLAKTPAYKVTISYLLILAGAAMIGMAIK